MNEIFKNTKKASRLARYDSRVLEFLAQITLDEREFLLFENKKDLEKLDKRDPLFDRLLLTEDRIKTIAHEIRLVNQLKSPLGLVLEERTLPNGLLLKKVSVPLGVVGVIYEARPNVTFDLFSLGYKSGNAVILRGSSSALNSNRAIVSLIHRALTEFNLPNGIAEMIPQELTTELLSAVEYVDVIIPRGGRSLIDFVRNNSKVPVIETGAGIVHIYFDQFGDLKKGQRILHNSKTRRPAVCNSVDCLIIHESRLKDLKDLLVGLEEVQIFADERSFCALSGQANVINKEEYGVEFLSLKLSIKTVSSLADAISHIEQFSSKHSEAIISDNHQNVEKFLSQVDAAVVYANASTAFTDGNQFGLGAEIGISTQKLHARGPMGLETLTSYKWIVQGDGQIRS